MFSFAPFNFCRVGITFVGSFCVHPARKLGFALLFVAHFCDYACVQGQVAGREGKNTMGVCPSFLGSERKVSFLRVLFSPPLGFLMSLLVGLLES